MARFFASAGALSSSSLYALFNGENGDGVYAIGAATREGSTWTEYGSNPVLQKGAAATWDDDHVKDPCLLFDGTQFVCYYAGYDGSKYQIGRATATAHTGAWTKAGGNPLIAVGSGGAIDDAGCNFPTVLYEPSDPGREYKMWYGANDGANQTIAYAFSTNGLAWTKVGKVVDVGSSGTWEDVGVLPMAIAKDGATYYLFYGGRQGTTVPKWQGGLVTFTDPAGTYTKYAGNPILLARFNDAGTTVVPTADVTAGATTVSLTETSAFNVGEAVSIIDGDTTAEHFYITALTSTLVTLSGTVVGNFTGGGKVFRSFAYNAVLPRSVLAVSGGGYEMFGTPFQPVEDLTQPASKLWEGSLEWTAAALTGTWAYRYVAGRGLLFPLSPGGAAWHSRSAENPSVVVGAEAVAESGAPDFVGWTGSTLSPLWAPVYSSPGDPGFGLDSDFMANLSKVSVAADVMTITATKVGSVWQSACMGTNGTYEFLYGTISCEINYPNGQGVWPAFWMLATGAVVTPPEVDMLEAYPGDVAMIGGPNFISTALHMASGIQSEIYNTGSDNTDEWHTYQMVWAPGSMKFYYDGTLYKTMTGDIPAVPMYPILNLALGATSYRTDGTTPTTLTMEARSLKVWEA